MLDTETTGFDYNQDRILSIGALVLKNYQIDAKDAFELYVKQDKFDSSTVPIHGILKNTKKDLLSELEALKYLLKQLENAVIVAHYAVFDIEMINRALKRNGLPKLLNKSLDTALLYKRLSDGKTQTNEQRITLDDLAKEFNIPMTDRHTALGDAYITAIALLKIMEKIKPESTKQLFGRNRFWHL